MRTHFSPLVPKVLPTTVVKCIQTLVFCHISLVYPWFLDSRMCLVHFRALVVFWGELFCGECTALDVYGPCEHIVGIWKLSLKDQTFNHQLQDKISFAFSLFWGHNQKSSCYWYKHRSILHNTYSLDYQHSRSYFPSCASCLCIPWNVGTHVQTFATICISFFLQACPTDQLLYQLVDRCFLVHHYCWKFGNPVPEALKSQFSAELI